MGVAGTAAWECRSCAVRVTVAPGFKPPDAPAGWVREGGAWTCLACARSAARRAARQGGGAELDRLVDSELRRGSPVHRVARETGADSMRVRKRRLALVRAGEVEAPSRGRASPDDDLGVLRRLGETDVRRFAEAVGVTEQTARRRLGALEGRGEATSRERGTGHDCRAKIFRPS